MALTVFAPHSLDIITCKPMERGPGPGMGVGVVCYHSICDLNLMWTRFVIIFINLEKMEKNWKFQRQNFQVQIHRGGVGGPPPPLFWQKSRFAYVNLTQK